MPTSSSEAIEPSYSETTSELGEPVATASGTGPEVAMANGSGSEPADSDPVEPEPTEPPREGSLTIFCQRVMQQGLQYDIAAFISEALTKEEFEAWTVSEAMEATENLDEATAERNTSGYRIKLADRVKVELVLPVDEDGKKLFTLVEPPQRRSEP